LALLNKLKAKLASAKKTEKEQLKKAHDYDTKAKSFSYVGSMDLR